MKKKKLKKYNSGTSYIDPQYNTTSVQKTGRGQAAANGLLGAGTTLAATGGQAMTTSAMQANYNNPEQGVSTGKMVGGGALKGAATGASMGAALGPYGMLIGAGVGAVAGGVGGALQAKKINNLASQTKKNNAAARKQFGYSAIENEQIGYAKKGLDMTKKKLKKYPNGTSSVATQKKQVDPTLPVFTSTEKAQLKGLVGTPVYKEAVRTAIGYNPTYPNPRPGSSQATFEQNAWNNAVGTFNKRDTTTAAPVDFSSFQAKQAQAAQSQMANYNSGNQKLDNHLMNQGAYIPTPGAMPNPLRRNTASYAGGTKGIKGSAKLADESKIALTPEERSALPPAGTPEHKQAIQQLLGYTPRPYPVGSQGYANQERMFNSAVEMINQGYRPAVSPSGHKGYAKVYGKGVKEVEIEGGEIVAEKKGSKFKVKGDFKGGPSHAEGGIRITAKEGDVIFPKHKRSEVVDAIEDGNHKKLESIRKGLPKDTNYKMAKGTKKVKKDDRDKTPPVSVSPKDFKPMNQYGANRFGASKMDDNVKLKNIKSVDTSQNPYIAPKDYTTSNSQNVAGSLAEVAPIAYNLGRGLFGKVQQTTRRNFNPTSIQYQDMSQPLRNEVQSLYNQDKEAIRNLAGGNSAVALANIGRASAGKFKRLQEINNSEAARKIATQNANTEMGNNAQLTNLQLNNQYDELDLANSARKDDFLATGLGQASQYAQSKVLDKNMRNRDNQIIDNLETSQYKLVNGKVVKKQKNGNAGIKVGKYKMKKC